MSEFKTPSQNSAKEAEKKKLIESCKKIFALMDLLLDREAKFKDIVDIFSQDEDFLNEEFKDTTLYSVELGKYINTLKLFGFNIARDKGRYTLLNSPFKINFSEKDLKVYDLIKNVSQSFENKDGLKSDFNKFLQSIEFRFSDNVKMLIKNRNTETDIDFSFYFANYMDKIYVCSNACKSEYNVELIYYKRNKIEKRIISPKNLIYQTGCIRLKFMDLKNYDYYTVAIDKIISLKQMPNKSRTMPLSSKTSVFALRGRLASNYTLRFMEELKDKNLDGWKVIVNTTEGEEELLKRLFKYADSCKVISPKSLKDAIIKQTDEILAIYQDT